MVSRSHNRLFISCLLRAFRTEDFFRQSRNMETIVKKTINRQHQLDDQLLIKEALGGNQQAFTCLLERYQHSIRQMIAKMTQNNSDGEDLTMEVFGKAFNSLESYRPHYAFSTWLFRIAINHCIDYLRKKRAPHLPIDFTQSASTTNDDPIANLISSNPNPEEIIIQKQRSEHLHFLLSRLSPRNRAILKMHYFEGRSYEEIAQDMGVPIGTVKAQLHRAREAMYILLLKNTPLLHLPVVPLTQDSQEVQGNQSTELVSCTSHG